MEGPATLPRDRQPRKRGSVLRGGTNREGGNPVPTTRERTPSCRVKGLQVEGGGDAESSEHGPKVNGLDGGDHLLYDMYQEVGTPLRDIPRK